MLFYVITVFHICIVQLSHIERYFLFTSSDLAWIPLSTCVYARWGGAGGSEELRRATDIWVGPTFVTSGNTSILPQLVIHWTLKRQVLLSKDYWQQASSVLWLGSYSERLTKVLLWRPEINSYIVADEVFHWKALFLLFGSLLYIS